MTPLKRVEFNITELCNRKCYFCPRAHGYPNKNLHMSVDIAKEAVKQTSLYTDWISLSGRGEPLLCNNFLDILDICSKQKVRFNTNGDKLTDSLLKEIDKIIDLNTRYGDREKVMVDSYDSLEQHNDRKKRWGHYRAIWFDYKPDKKIESTDQLKKLMNGKVNNRGGSLPFTSYEWISKPCYYLYFKTMIDWNGDVNLCCHNWEDIKVFGNIIDTSFVDIWEGDEMNKWRQGLTKGRTFKQCMECDNMLNYEESKKIYELFQSKKN